MLTEVSNQHVADTKYSSLEYLAEKHWAPLVNCLYVSTLIYTMQGTTTIFLNMFIHGRYLVVNVTQN